MKPSRGRRLGLPHPALTAAAVSLASLLLGATLASPAKAQDPAAERLFAEAERQRQGGDIRGALEEYELLVRQFPNDRLTPTVLFQMAKQRRHLDDNAGARSTLKKLLDNHPRTPEAAAGFLLQAEMKVADARSYEELEDARAVFRRVPLLFGTDAYPALEARAKARYRGAELDLLLGDPGSARAELVAAVEDEPPSTSRDRSRLLLGRVLLEADETPAGLEILQGLIDEEPDTEAAPSFDGSSDRRAAKADIRAQASRLLSLAHRHRLRTSAGQVPWTRTERFPSGMGLRAPSGVAAAEDGQVLIIDPKTSLVILSDSTGGALQTRQIKSAQRPAFADGVPFVVSDSEIVLPFQGHRQGFVEPRPGKDKALDGLRNAARDPYGDWFVQAKGWKGLLVYRSRRESQELLAALQPKIVDLARDSLGRVYVLDQGDDRVLRIGVDRRTQEILIQDSWKRAEALAVDNLGQIYVLDRGTAKVFIYGQDGKRRSEIGPTFAGGVQLRDPRDLAVDGSGRLFIADTRLPFVVLLD